MLYYFVSDTRCMCWHEGFRHEIELSGNPKVIFRETMDKKLFLLHAENHSKSADNGKYYHEPTNEILSKLPDALNNYLAPLEKIKNIGQFPEEKRCWILLQIVNYMISENQISDEYKDIAINTLRTCSNWLNDEGTTAYDISELICSEDGRDIVEISCNVSDEESVFWGNLICIVSYILAAAIYKEEGDRCSLPEYLDHYQGENMSDMFITLLLDLIHDGFINADKISNIGRFKK